MKLGSTFLLRLAVIAMGLFVLFLCYLVLPSIATSWTEEFPNIHYLQIPMFVWLSLSTVPFYVALYQSMKILGYIDKKQTFSQLSVVALRRVKYSGGALGLLYIAGSPMLYALTQVMDAPGILAIGLMISFASFSIGLFAGVLEHLLADMVAIKSENDLTV